MTHPPLLDALDDVAGHLAGVVVDPVADTRLSVALDPADVSLPGVIVYPNTLDWSTLDGADYDLTVDLVLVAGAIGARDAVGQLDQLLAAVRSVFPVPEARAVSLALPSHSPDPLPALQATVAFRITREEDPA